MPEQAAVKRLVNSCERKFITFVRASMGRVPHATKLTTLPARTLEPFYAVGLRRKP
jgi:hypothetical protein